MKRKILLEMKRMANAWKGKKKKEKKNFFEFENENPDHIHY